MEDMISQLKMKTNMAKERFSKTFAAVPDDKLNWSPSPTARTPLQIAAHVGLSSSGFAAMIRGEKFPFSSMDQMETAMRAEEAKITSRQQALSVIDATTAEFITSLDTLTPEKIGSAVTLPLGEMPMTMIMGLGPDHITQHASQIDYIETIWGDFDWHM